MPATAHKVVNATEYSINYDRAVQNSSAWDILTSRALQHTAPYGMPNQVSHQVPYSLYMQLRHQIGWEDLVMHAVQLTAPYQDLGIHQLQNTAPYHLNVFNMASHSCGYDIEGVTPLKVQNQLVYSVLSTVAPRSVVNNPQFSWGGVLVSLLSAELSCDEDSSVWIATLSTLDAAAFSAISIMDEIILSVTMVSGVEDFSFIVDSKQLSRGDNAEVTYVVSAISPLALLGSPFASEITVKYPAIALASVIVTDLIGAVSWQLPDWQIPAGEAVFANVTPLEAAKRVLAAIGGIIESTPNGSVVCRLRHPVNIPDYYTAAVDHSLFDDELLSSSSDIGTAPGFNRVSLSNDTGDSYTSSDVLEEVPHPSYPDSTTVKRVRGYLSTVRPVLLVHTSNPATVITPLGEQTRTETELVEFIEGVARTRYIIDTIVSMSWQSVDLGLVTCSGTKVTSTVVGYSLLSLTYTVKSYDWDVSLNATQDVQFIIVSA